MEFQYNLPVNLIFGRGKSGSIGEVAAKYGKKILVVTGTGSTNRSGLLDRTVLCLKKAGVESEVFDKVTQNPLTTTVLEGVELAKKKRLRCRSRRRRRLDHGRGKGNCFLLCK